MLNIEEIHEEIKKLENCDHTTYEVCQKLAILYTVRNNYTENSKMVNNTVPSPISMSTPSMVK